MTRYLCTIFLGLVTMTFVQTGSAEDGFFIGVGGGQAEANELVFSDFDDGSGLAGSFEDSDSAWKVYGGYNFSKYIAIEIAFVDLGVVSFDAVSDGSGSVFNPGPVTGSVAAQGPSVFLMGLVPVSDNFRLFAKAGVMAWTADVLVSNSAFGDADAKEDGSDTAYGLGAQYHFSDRFSVRAEWERFTSIIDRDGQLLSLSAQFSFGGKTAPMPAPAIERDGDGDRDGVPDSRDECPNSPAGQSVDTRGCARDSDRDGVTDDEDQCPNTVGEAAVDARGCELDSDSDRVVNRLDDCPNTKAGARVDVKGCEIREVIDLPGVNFQTNSDQLLSGAESVLDDAAATLRMNHDLVVEVAGHTDDAGDAVYNEGLSERRANTVRDFLMNRGANPSNLTARGYGEAAPVADNATAEGRARNRRVELRIQNR